MAIPLAIFSEWNLRHRNAVVSQLSEDLRKLSSSNDTGLTLLESLKTVSDTTSGKLAQEFETMHAKVNYGMSLKESLIEFNNKYHIPRLARTTRLITEAQEASIRSPTCFGRPPRPARTTTIWSENGALEPGCRSSSSS